MTDARLAHYDWHYFMEKKQAEIVNYAAHHIRHDQLACLHYSLMVGDGPLSVTGGAVRIPRLVLEVGAGRGELSALFALCGIAVMAIEPSETGNAIYRDTMREWAQVEPRVFENISEVNEVPDTIVFCESIEHIPEEEFETDYWPAVKMWLSKTSGRLVIANWLRNHPIVPDGTGWDHVRVVDDLFYDRLSNEARRVVFRTGSHLVLDW